MNNFFARRILRLQYIKTKLFNSDVIELIEIILDIISLLDIIYYYLLLSIIIYYSNRK